MNLFDAFSKLPRFRIGLMLLAGGLAGFLLMGFMVQIPLPVTLAMAIFIGVWGVAAAVIERILRTVSRKREPIFITQRQPFEFVSFKNGFVNLARVEEVAYGTDGSLILYFGIDNPRTLYDEDARALLVILRELATPLNEVADLQSPVAPAPAAKGNGAGPTPTEEKQSWPN